MDDKVIEFRRRESLNAFSALEKDAWGLGYNVVPTSLAERIFKDMRGKNRRDYAAFVVRREGEDRFVSDVSLSGSRDMSDAPGLLGCRDFALAHIPKLVRGSDIRVVEGSDGYRAVYAKGEDATFGVCYLDSADTPKGLMMAALLLYAFAMLNMFVDYELFKNVFSYLPFVPKIGLDFRFFLHVEDLVDECVGRA